MTKFEIGLSEIESISKRLEMAMNSRRHPARAEPIRRSGSTAKGKGIRISRKIINIYRSREIT
jgi:hypothetical protein